MQAPRPHDVTDWHHEQPHGADEPLVEGSSQLTPAATPSPTAPSAPADGPPGQGWRGLGESMARRRRELGLSLAQAEAATKVRAAYLRAIEAGRPEEVPGEAYARGFVRLYARLLGLDGRDLMRRHGISRPAPPLDDTPEPPARGIEWLPWAVAAAAVVLVGALFLLLHG